MNKVLIVDKARNLWGPLKPECRTRLKRVLEAPNQKTWDDAHSLIINARHWITLWQAWVQIDEKAPRSKPTDGPWPVIPDAFTVYRALKWAVEQK